MRIVSYNILDGGGARRDAIGEVIAGQRPDVVCLLEAEDPAVVEQLANAAKMDFIVAPGKAHASALLSRWPIRQTINHALLSGELSNSFLEATVLDPAGPAWTIGVVHLHGRGYEADEQVREKELAVVLGVFAERRKQGRPHLLAGDFNANAPCQAIDLARCRPKTKLEWEMNGNCLPRRVVQTLLDAGYRDSLREVDPRAAETAGTFDTDFPGRRFDYIFTFAMDPRALRRAWIEAGEPARRAGDHFPIGLEISA